MTRNEIITDIMFKVESVPTKTVNRLAVNEEIPFDQTEPFHVLALTIQSDLLDALQKLKDPEPKR